MTAAKKEKPTGATLFQINDELRALEELLESIEEGATEDDAEVIAAWLGEYDDAFNGKVASWVTYMRTQEALEKGLDEEAKRLNARKKVHHNRIDRMKNALMFIFDERSITKVETARGTVACQENGGVTPLEVLVTDATLLPPRFQKVTISADTDAIRTALEAGEDVTTINGMPGARLGERGRHIRLR